MPKGPRILLTAAVIFAALLGLVWAGAPRAVQAQDGCPDDLTPQPTTPDYTGINVCEVQPTTIYNDVASTITITGNDFNNAVVVMEGFSALATTNVSPEVLTAIVPPGAPQGRYTIRVINQDGASAQLNNILRVVDRLTVPQPTGTQPPTSTPEPTNFIRPIITVLSYGASSSVLVRGQEIDFEITLQNTGAITAYNVIVKFGTGSDQDDLIPRVTGGLRSVGNIDPGAQNRFWQPLRVNSNLTGNEAVMDIEIRYTDQYGVEYVDSSVLSFKASHPAATLTPTATLSVRPQLIIEQYSTDPDTLTPGGYFALNFNLVNVSGEVARQVVVTLRQSEFSLESIAPLSTSNVRYVDQLQPGGEAALTFQLAVNGSAEGGLVPLDLELKYIDNYNVEHTETETISLPVIAQPHLQIGLFEPLPDFILVGDTFDIPIEVINIGSQQVNVGTVEILSPGKLDIDEGSLYVGPLDPGTSGTLVATATAAQAGTATFEVRVHYLSSFQQPEVITETFTVEIEPAPLPVLDGEGASGAQEDGQSFLDRIWQAVLGFFGLGTRPAVEPTSEPAGDPVGGPGGDD